MGGERHRTRQPEARGAAASPSDEVVGAARNAAGYALLDAGDGERLERWGAYVLRRPDARALALTRRLPADAWRRADAHYRGDAGSGAWSRRTDLPERWLVTHGDVILTVKLAPYKHTGVFPEQAAHWRWMQAMAAHGGRHAQDAEPAGVHRPLRVLNLFAYTGGATLALAKAGCHVTHVDASKPALAWAKENARANDLPADAIRWIEDDAAAFVARELRRGRTYDAALLDPPAFGRAPKGRATGGAAGGGLWRLDEHLPALLRDLRQLLPDPLFVLINDYARDADAGALAALLHQTMRGAGAAEAMNASGLHAASLATAGLDTTGLDAAIAHDAAPTRIRRRAELQAGRLSIEAEDGRRLETGVFARWWRPAAR